MVWCVNSFLSLPSLSCPRADFDVCGSVRQDFHAEDDLPRLARMVEYHFTSSTGAILEGFRTG